MRNNPATSIDAFKSLKPDQVREVYKKILDALKVLGQASSEQIAEYLTMEHAKIHKRVSEMQGLSMIYRPGLRVPTKSGRTAFVWAIQGTLEKTDKEVVYKKEEKSAHQFSSDLIKSFQQILFP